MVSRSLHQEEKQDSWFLLDIEAIVGLVGDLVNVENPVLKYFLTYKITWNYFPWLGEHLVVGTIQHLANLRQPTSSC